MERMLIFGLTTGVGGVQSYLMNLYRNINRNQIQFDFVVAGDNAYYEDEIKKLGGTIYYITPKKDNVLKNVVELFKLLQKIKGDYNIVYFNMSILYYNIPFILTKLFRFPTIISHAHSAKPAKIKRNLRYYLHLLNRVLVAHTSNYLLSCSDNATEWVFGKGKYITGKVKIVPNAIDSKKYIYDSQKRGEARLNLELNEENLVFGNIGRLTYEKNHLFLLDVFYEIKKLKKNSKLLLVGDGINRSRIERKIIDMGIKESVIMTGARSDIPELLNAMDVFVMPSLYEGLGISLIEAQVSGLPCFTSKYTVPTQVNITGNVSFIDLEKSPKYWASYIIKSFNKSERENQMEKIKSAGYEIEDISKSFQDFILKL